MQTKPCPMCNPKGWLDEEGKPLKAVTNKYTCMFCGGTGELMVLEQDDLEGEQDEEMDRDAAPQRLFVDGRETEDRSSGTA